jgi:hypothetical protein
MNSTRSVFLFAVFALAAGCASKDAADPQGGSQQSLQGRSYAEITVTRTATETRTATQTSTATSTATQTVTQTATATTTVTTPGSGTVTVTQIVTATSTATATQTETATVTATRTVTSTGTRTGTAPGTYQQIYTFTGTVTATSTGIVYYASWPHAQGNTATATTNQYASGTGVATVTRTLTSPLGGTETKTASATVTGSGTKTGTTTVTVTATVTSATTNAGTGTRTTTATGTATGTATQTWTATWTTRVTQTVTSTSTGTVTNTNTVTNTETATISNTLTLTATQTVSTTLTTTTTNTSTVTSTSTTTNTTTNTETVTTTVTVTTTETQTDTSVDGGTGTGDGGVGRCLQNWRGTTCGAWCTRETQTDRMHCADFLDCYEDHGVGPTDNPDGTCGVNRFNFGMVPKTIADQVYQCLGCPGTTPVTSCAGMPDATPCSDNNACTQTDTCHAGACVGSNPKVCTAPDLCHVPGTCEPSTGECVGSGDVTCTALDECHEAGACDLGFGCSNPAKADGTPCGTGGTVCIGGLCGSPSGVCIVSDNVTNIPNFNAPDLAAGYAKLSMPGIGDLDALKLVCTREIYESLLAQHCALSKTPVQAQVASFFPDGSPYSVGCGAIGCERLHCPVLGACVVSNNVTNIPNYFDPDVAPGYAKLAITGATSVEDLKVRCTNAIYDSLLGQYCAVSDRPVQAQVVVFNDDGTPNTTSCGAIGCDRIACPVLGACVVSDNVTNIPNYFDPDIAPGYAKLAMTGATSVDDLRVMCTNAIYENLLAQHCALSDTAVQAQVAVFNRDGSPNTTGCGAVGCDRLHCE